MSFKFDLVSGMSLIIYKSQSGKYWLKQDFPSNISVSSIHRGLHGVVNRNGKPVILLGDHPMNYYGYRLLGLDIADPITPALVERINQLLPIRPDRHVFLKDGPGKTVILFDGLIQTDDSHVMKMDGTIERYPQHPGYVFFHYYDQLPSISGHWITLKFTEDSEEWSKFMAIYKKVKGL